jgi:SpoIID/LytB domain protein
MRNAKYPKNEPTISVGLMTGVEEVRFRLSGEFVSAEGQRFPPGDYQAKMSGDHFQIQDLSDNLMDASPEIKLIPSDLSACVFTIAEITIGVDFHWQRQEAQGFQGTLKLLAWPSEGLIVINEVPLELYLTSVISSEMSAACPPELLKAHTVISRSWVLAQKSVVSSQQSVASRQSSTNDQRLTTNDVVVVRWYSRESHQDFDVCADDHCQRYQGVTKAFSKNVFDAVTETRGLVLTYGDAICDARFSKCCGGMTENYRSAWEDVDIPYLIGRFDGSTLPDDFPLPLTEEQNAERWITGSPQAYCNTSDQAIIEKILPDFDQETKDFFRWEVRYNQDELREILETKLGIDLGYILALEPLERGVSSRIVKLRITGEKHNIVVGKELEIRRVLSRSHLYSSAFVVRPEGKGSAPGWFRLIGAGWGHGVGLCQIGAAVMAEIGKNYREILSHYYPGSVVSQPFVDSS